MHTGGETDGLVSVTPAEEEAATTNRRPVWRPSPEGDGASRQYSTLDCAHNLRAFVAQIAEGIYITTPDGEIIDGNPALLRIFGASSLDELRQHNTTELLADPQERVRHSKLLAQQGYLRDFELQIQRLDGTIRTVLDTVFCQYGDDGQVIAHHGILIDITERKKLEQRYFDLCVRDPLTGCHNRRHLERLSPKLERPSATWGCILLDIDNFKALNDTYGHDEGDRILQGLVHFLRRHGRVEDVLIRLGGDEFAIIIRDSSRETIQQTATRLLELATDEAPATFSLGVACRRANEPIVEVIARADRAMYASKGRGLRAVPDF